MSNRPERLKTVRSSRQRYLRFVEDYKKRRLDEAAETEKQKALEDPAKPGEDVASPPRERGKRREYMREYLRWLWPHRYAAVVVFVLALLGAGLEMIEPLFMRFIVDRVLLDTQLDATSRLNRLNFAGAIFLLVIVFSNLIGVLRNYRQR